MLSAVDASDGCLLIEVSVFSGYLSNSGPVHRFLSQLPRARRYRGRWSCHTIVIGLWCALTLPNLGCHSRAHRDVYHASMAKKIRILEDQLNEADYQNQVLREKLQRVKSHSPPVLKSQQAPAYQPHIVPPQVVPSIDDFDMGVGFGETIIENDAFAPTESVPVPGPEAAAEDLPAADDAEMLPPPGGPEPPGARDLDVPPIEPGEILPPPAAGEENDAPPGQIKLPNSLGMLPAPMPIPQMLQLHAGLSGGHRFDDQEQTDGLYLVVNVIDDQGQMLDLTEFEIDASMSIVALDPAFEESASPIARWEFGAQEIQDFVRSEPVAGLHIPVRWQGTRPSGEEVIVHVRLQTEDEEMRCAGRLKVSEPAAIADWTPRGGKQKR